MENNEFELVDLPQDPVSELPKDLKEATHELTIDQHTLAVSIKAKVEKAIMTKETKDGDIVLAGINPQIAINELLPEIPILAHNSLGFPYEYNQETGLWKKITSNLSEYIDDKYLLNWLFNESLNPAIYDQRRRLARDFATKLQLYGEDSKLASDPNPSTILFKNGAYNYETNTIEKPTPDQYHTVQLPYNLVPTNERTIVEDWIEWIVGDSLQTIMELIGYCMYRNYKYATITYLVNDPTKSSGSNGKSNLLSYMTHVLGGTDNVSSVPLDNLASKDDKFSSATLQHKLANIETDSDTKHMSHTGTLKSLSGNDIIFAQNKNKDPFTFRNYAKLFISTNNLPTFSDNSYGMIRRLIVIPFIKDFKDGSHSEEMNKFESQRKAREDYNGETIGKFAWNCLQAFRAILTDPKRNTSNNPFYNSTLGKEMRTHYIENNDVTKLFLDASDLIVTKNEEDRLQVSDVKDKFVLWKEDNESSVKWLNMKRNLEKLGVEHKSAQIKTPHGKTVSKCFIGIREKRKGE